MADAVALRAKAERLRRLASALTDPRARADVLELAQIAEAEAVALEQGWSGDDEMPRRSTQRSH